MSKVIHKSDFKHHKLNGLLLDLNGFQKLINKRFCYGTSSGTCVKLKPAGKPPAKASALSEVRRLDILRGSRLLAKRDSARLAFYSGF